MGKTFQLENKTAILLYQKYAKEMPIFDYHCHLSAKEIYENRQFNNLTEVWVVDGNYGDHYKWRAMRANGIPERYITGNASAEDKFLKWAETVPYTIGNPLYHWTHMELKHFFGITKVLSPKTAQEIYYEANKRLETLTAREMITMSNVNVICTTDDPVDSLEWHLRLQDDKSFKTTVLPAFRPDKAINIELDWFSDWIDELGKVTKMIISSISDLLLALTKRIDFFHMVGCRLSDHALDEVVFVKTSEEEVAGIFLKGLRKEELTKSEIAKYKGFILVFLGREYAKRNWVQQYHIGALRNNSKRLLDELGPDTGFDAINDKAFANKLANLLDELDSTNSLPKTILYCLNPRDNEVLATIAGCFQGGIKGKIQFGSGWWFNDQKDGMIKQMTALSNMGLISGFIGMLTDSRSFMSYPRHDYFRRILCNMLGKLIENGEYPADIEFVGSIVQDICYNNAFNYFNVEVKK